MSASCCVSQLVAQAQTPGEVLREVLHALLYLVGSQTKDSAVRAKAADRLLSFKNPSFVKLLGDNDLKETSKCLREVVDQAVQVRFLCLA
jgi:hypothetical protein